MKIKSYGFKKTKQTSGIKTTCETEFITEIVVPNEVLNKFPNLGK